MSKLIVIIFFLAGVSLVSCENKNTTSLQNDKTEKIKAEDFVSPKTDYTADEAWELSRKGALILDVREPSEVAELAFRVKNIKTIPLGDLESRIAEVPINKQVILVCRRGHRSLKAFDLLKAKGFINMANMKGGMESWIASGLPITRGIGKKACCSDPNSKKCNPDGSCK